MQSVCSAVSLGELRTLIGNLEPADLHSARANFREHKYSELPGVLAVFRQHFDLFTTVSANAY